MRYWLTSASEWKRVCCTHPTQIQCCSYNIRRCACQCPSSCSANLVEWHASQCAWGWNTPCGVAHHNSTALLGDRIGNILQTDSFFAHCKVNPRHLRHITSNRNPEFGHKVMLKHSGCQNMQGRLITKACGPSSLLQRWLSAKKMLSIIILHLYEHPVQVRLGLKRF